MNVINHVVAGSLDYENCKCRKKLIDALVEEYSEDFNGNELIYNATLNNYEKVCKSCRIYIVLLVLIFKITISINSICIYFYWYLKRSNTNTITNAYTNTETVIY